MGERAVLAEVASLGEVLALRAALAASAPAGVVDIVPAARTVLVHLDPRVLSLSAARAWIAGAEATDAADAATAPVEVVLDIAYDGPDLAETAELLGLSVEALAARHAGTAWTVAFTGFAPGFAYLASTDWAFDVPRLAAPRTRVPAGGVGLAGEFSGAYPRETPGGWRLIGTTAARLFDPAAEPPALLIPGTPVRFRPVAVSGSVGSPLAPLRDAAPTVPPGASPATASSTDPRAGSSVGADAPMAPPEPAALRIEETGLLATVQDLGRTGRASLGIARSGALDRAALRTANRLVGNAEDAAGIEVTMGGLRAVALRDLWFAVAGAWGGIHVDGESVDPYTAHAWPVGSELRLDHVAHGVRAYLAVRGGIGGAGVAGSCATDVLAGLGPSPQRPGPLRAGDLLPIGNPAGPVPSADVAPWGAPPDDDVEVELAPGPRADWFAASALTALFETAWTVTQKTDRVGVRLAASGAEGTLERVRGGELPSEGMVPGAIQVPPSGQPTVLLADGPVTGGYPVIAVVADASLDAFAQARPGTRIRFRHARR